MRVKGFKDKASPEVIDNFRKHIMTHEMMIMDKAMINPLYQQQAAQLVGFPIFMESPMPTDSFVPVEQQAAQANQETPEETQALNEMGY